MFKGVKTGMKRQLRKFKTNQQQQKKKQKDLSAPNPDSASPCDCLGNPAD